MPPKQFTPRPQTMGPFFLPARASLARKAADNARVMTSHRPPYRRLAVALAIPLLLSACEIPGLGPSAQELQREAEAQAAIEGTHGQNMGGRDLVVNIARPMEPRPPRSGGFGGGNNGGGYNRRSSY